MLLLTGSSLGDVVDCGWFYMYQRNYYLSHLKWEAGRKVIVGSCFHMDVENVNYQMIFYLKRPNFIFLHVLSFRTICVQIMHITYKLSL